MSKPYKRRRPRLIRTFWLHRRLVGLAIVLGVLLWFVWANWTEVDVVVPFWGTVRTRMTIIILIGVLTGAVATGLGITAAYSLRRRRERLLAGEEDDGEWADERPPSDYGAKTTDGFSDAPWSRG